MSGLVLDSALAHFKASEEVSSQAVTSGLFEDVSSFCKRPPDQITDPEARKWRILNEAICGKLVELLNRKLGAPFLTPIHRLVINSNKELVAVLTHGISYDYMGDYSLNKKDLLAVLQKPGLAEISTIRYFLKDPDGLNNIGYSKDKLSSIDYGLANCLDLLKRKTLTPSEQEILAAARNKDVFNITIASVFLGILQTRGDENFGFLAHHVIDRFNESIAEFCDSNKETVAAFFQRVNRTYSVIAALLTSSAFKASIREELDIDKLSEEDQRYCDELIQGWIDQGTTLKNALNVLRRCSPVQFEKLVTDSQVDDRVAPVILSASPQYRYSRNLRSNSLFINAIVAENADQELQKQASLGRITLANGGGSGGYSDVLKPVASSVEKEIPILKL